MNYLDTYKNISSNIDNIATAIARLLNKCIDNSNLIITELNNKVIDDLNKYNYPIYPDDYEFTSVIPKLKYRDHYSTWLQIDKNTGDIYSSISSNLDVYNPFIIATKGNFYSALSNGIGENYTALTNAQMEVAYWLFNSMQYEDNMVESDIKNLSDKTWYDFSNLDMQLNQGLTNLKSYIDNKEGLNASQVDQAIHTITDPITQASSDLYDYAHSLYDKTVAYLQPKIDAVSQYAKDIYTNIYNYFHPIITDLSNYAHSVYQSVLDTLNPVISEAEQDAKNYAANITNNLQSAINSVSNYAHSIYTSAVNYLDPKITAISNYAHTIYDKAVNYLEPKITAISNYAHTIYDKAVNYLEPKITAISNYAHTIYDKAVNYLQPIIQGVKDYAINLVSSTKTALQSSIATLSSYAHTIYDKAVDFLQPKIDAVKVYTNKVYNESLAYTNSAISKVKASFETVTDSIEKDLLSVFQTFDKINTYLSVTLKEWEDTVSDNQKYFMSLIQDPAKLLSVLFNINVAKWIEIKPMLQTIAIHILELP